MYSFCFEICLAAQRASCEIAPRLGLDLTLSEFLHFYAPSPKKSANGGIMKKLLIYIVIVAATAAILWEKPTVADTNGKLSSNLVKTLAEKQKNVDVLLKMTAIADLSGARTMADPMARRQLVYDRLVSVAKSSQRNLVQSLNARGLEYERFYLVNLVLVKNASLEDIQAFAKRADVAKIYGSNTVELMPPLFDVPKMTLDLDAETNIQSVGADRVWNEFGVKGAGIVVAGQDTGVQWDHPALIKQYRGAQNGTVDHNYNWFDAIQTPITGGSKCAYGSTAPCDDHAHGTHTVGTIIGEDGPQYQIGMAPEAQWIACRNMDDGTGRPQTYIKCFEFLFAPHALDKNGMQDGKPELAAHVINNSWGCPSSELCEGDIMLDILRNMKAAGIFVVVSAGNDGPGCKTIDNTPAWHSADSFSVGAHDHRNNRIASFSSRGPSGFDGEIGPDITAPGVRVTSAVPGNTYQGSFWSGTSMAGPHVAGLVALMWSANTNLIGQIDETIRLIQETAVPTTASACMDAGKGNDIPNNTFGHGRIDAYRAVEAALAWTK